MAKGLKYSIKKSYKLLEVENLPTLICPNMRRDILSPLLSGKALRILIPFATSSLCDAGFLAVASWHNMETKAKSKNARIKNYRGGAPLRDILTSWEESIVNSIGPTTSVGHPEIKESLITSDLDKEKDLQENLIEHLLNSFSLVSGFVDRDCSLSSLLWLKKWSAELTIKFLEGYESYPCLWDVHSSSYKNKDGHENAHQKLSELMDIEGFGIAEVKTKISSIRNAYALELTKIKKSQHSGAGQEVKEIWRKLRDCHRDALRRQGKRKSGDAAKAIKLWTYQDERSNTIEVNLVSPASQDFTEGANENTQDDEVDQAEEPQYIQRSRGNTVATPDTPNIGAKKRKIDIMLFYDLDIHNMPVSVI
ncbi:unnamed protein product [Psylliodes chrysocephalus]|uniref:MADF domain-containing protein n=1 Tax=Psylliodes chrysocephalus TaxID=3402493 RepID=A0A9P0GDK5_9CUCU|nr:unnamed protein product [Psylliodes chrysocephala]